MNGHGHVTPNADGSRARCGGPGICPVCNGERAALWRQIGMAQQHLAKHAPPRPTARELASKVLREHAQLGVFRCVCGWDYDDTVPDVHYSDHVSHVLAVAGLLR